MPGLQFQNLPADQTTKIHEGFLAQWKIEANALKQTPFPDAGKARAAVAKLNARYQQMELKAFTQLQQQTEEQQRVQTLIRQPRERTRGQEAQLRMELRPEAESLVFPTERMGRFSTDQMIKFDKNMEAFAEAVPKSGTWGSRVRKQSDLVKQYEKMQILDGYAAMTIHQKQAYDYLWDNRMAKNESYKWDPGSPEVKALRGIGKLQQAAAKNISPLGMSVMKKKKRFAIPGYAGLYSAGVAQKIVSPEVKTLNRETAQQILNQAKGDKELARRIAREQGYNL